MSIAEHSLVIPYVQRVVQGIPTVPVSYLSSPLPVLLKHLQIRA